MRKIILPVLITLLLTACGRVETVTECITVPVLPPEVMLTEVKTPSAANLRTNGDLIEYILELREALSEANAKLRAIGKWRWNLNSDGDTGE